MARGDRGESREHVCTEANAKLAIRALHRGQDPWLFLDLRAGRRRLRELAQGRSVLNLFAYTCAAGVAAACAGASEVWNVDFSRSALEVGRRNAELNGVEMTFVQEDCRPSSARSRAAREGPRQLPRLRTLSSCTGRRLLDPPAWSGRARRGRRRGDYACLRPRLATPRAAP